MEVRKRDNLRAGSWVGRVLILNLDDEEGEGGSIK